MPNEEGPDEEWWREHVVLVHVGERDAPFANPRGRSALRAATRDNPRNLPCPTCKAPNRLTPADQARGYQCDACAEREEGGP